MANEKLRPEHLNPLPDVLDSEFSKRFRWLALPALVKMKLDSFRDLDKMHLRDLIEAGLVDQSWTARLPAALAERLQQLLDTPDG